ncbi:MAG: hypothetical protein KJ025_17585 [Burkholderiales bacterium]|nr:hypothetical protein [Burkholderiales bacterium]
MSYDPGLILIASTAIALVALIAWRARSAWSAVMHDDHVGLMAHMFARQGVRLPAGDLQYAEAEGRALRRCAMCTETTRCAHFLAAGGGEGFEAFCPNAGFIRAMQRGRVGV